MALLFGPLIYLLYVRVPGLVQQPPLPPFSRINHVGLVGTFSHFFFFFFFGNAGAVNPRNPLELTGDRIYEQEPSRYVGENPVDELTTTKKNNVLLSNLNMDGEQQ